MPKTSTSNVRCHAWPGTRLFYRRRPWGSDEEKPGSRGRGPGFAADASIWPIGRDGRAVAVEKRPPFRSQSGYSVKLRLRTVCLFVRDVR